MSPSVRTHESNDVLPPWHTAALITLIVMVAVVGSLLPSAVAPTSSAAKGDLGRYGPLLLVQWGLVLYVCRVGRTRSVLRELVGRLWDGPRRALADTAIAVAAATAIVAVNAAYMHLLRVAPSGAVSALLPRTPVERAAWVIVAISAGFCEEVVYRGYLLQELSRKSRSVTLGVISQGVLFGLAHLDQGTTAACAIAVYGVALGALAGIRGSLLPGIICHAAVDLASGLVRT